MAARKAASIRLWRFPIPLALGQRPSSPSPCAFALAHAAYGQDEVAGCPPSRLGGGSHQRDDSAAALRRRGGRGVILSREFGKRDDLSALVVNDARHVGHERQRSGSGRAVEALGAGGATCQPRAACGPMRRHGRAGQVRIHARFS
jgi:hypothetical protein